MQQKDMYIGRVVEIVKVGRGVRRLTGVKARIDDFGIPSSSFSNRHDEVQITILDSDGNPATVFDSTTGNHVFRMRRVLSREIVSVDEADALREEKAEAERIRIERAEKRRALQEHYENVLAELGFEENEVWVVARSNNNGEPEISMLRFSGNGAEKLLKLLYNGEQGENAD
jgi:hypothetical protein